MAEFTLKYIALCRELQPSRAVPVHGDIYAEFFEDHPPKLAVYTDGSGLCFQGGGFSAGFLGSEWVWLPREADLLDELEAGGLVVDLSGPFPRKQGTQPWRVATYVPLGERPEHGRGPDAKTALLRLCVAVKGIEL